MPRIQEVPAPDADVTGVPSSLVNWLVARGERVTAGARIAEILVGDVLLEVVAPASGRIVRKIVAVDEEIVPGQTLAKLEVADSEIE